MISLRQDETRGEIILMYKNISRLMIQQNITIFTGGVNFRLSLWWSISIHQNDPSSFLVSVKQDHINKQALNTELCAGKFDFIVRMLACFCRSSKLLAESDRHLKDIIQTLKVRPEKCLGGLYLSLIFLL